jgi:hypothetical protein
MIAPDRSVFGALLVTFPLDAANDFLQALGRLVIRTILAAALGRRRRMEAA